MNHGGYITRGGVGQLLAIFPSTELHFSDLSSTIFPKTNNYPHIKTREWHAF